jgi:hypothetical protein
MDFIFVSSKKIPLLSELSNIQKEHLGWIVESEQPGYYTSEHKWQTTDDLRLMHCYFLSDEQENRYSSDNEKISFFHGYLLEDSYISGGKKTFTLNPKRNYYGIYSHGNAKAKGDCFFSSDEFGLSPIYYAQGNGFTFVSNNSHLIAVYQYALGFYIRPEPTLPLWHENGLTIESDNTGYAGIKKVPPFRYLTLDFDDNLSLPSKEKIKCSSNYEEAVRESINELNKGIRAFASRFELTAALTGGYDTRLVLASILNTRLKNKVHFTTSGYDDNPDIIIAKQLATLYKLNLTTKTPISPHFPNSLEELFQQFRKIVVWTGMERALVCSTLPKIVRERKKDKVLISGLGAEFSRPIVAQNYIATMKRKFKGIEIDFDHLTTEQLAISYDMLGYSDNDRFYLTEQGFNIYRNYRKYIFDYSYSRFPERLNFADTLYGFKQKSYHAGFSYRNSNALILYNPNLIETGRMLKEYQRRDAKFYFDMIYQIDPKLALVPLENRKWNPEWYSHLRPSVKRRFDAVQPVTNPIILNEQEKRFEMLLPWMQENLIDAIPTSVFDIIRKDAIEERLMSSSINQYGRPVFPLINMLGITIWHQVIQERFPDSRVNSLTLKK